MISFKFTNWKSAARAEVIAKKIMMKFKVLNYLTTTTTSFAHNLPTEYEVNFLNKD